MMAFPAKSMVKEALGSRRLWLLLALAAIGKLFGTIPVYGAAWVVDGAQILAIPALLGVAFAVFQPKWSFRVAAFSAAVALLIALPIQSFRHSVAVNGLHIGNTSMIVVSGIMSADVPAPIFREIHWWLCMEIIGNELLTLLPVIALLSFGVIRGQPAAMLAGFMSGLVFGCFGAAFGSLENGGLYDDTLIDSRLLARMSIIIYQCAYGALQQAQLTAIASYFISGTPKGAGVMGRFAIGFLLIVALHFASYILFDYDWVCGLATIVLFASLYASACSSGDAAPVAAATGDSAAGERT